MLLSLLALLRDGLHRTGSDTPEGSPDPAATISTCLANMTHSSVDKITFVLHGCSLGAPCEECGADTDIETTLTCASGAHMRNIKTAFVLAHADHILRFITRPEDLFIQDHGFEVNDLAEVGTLGYELDRVYHLMVAVRCGANAPPRPRRNRATCSCLCAVCGRRVDKHAGGGKCICRLVRYCSSTCQSDDWPRHKAACRAARAAMDTMD